MDGRRGLYKWNKKKSFLSILFILIFLYLIYPLPKFNAPASKVIYSREKKLLGAKIADDEQWRFPELETVPEKFRRSIISFEDRYFYFHPGFNPGALIRAGFQNIKAGRIVSGGSTLSMQVIRLARKGRERTIKEKLIEIVLSTKLELKYSKKKILALYASYAPFGGNVVGLEAASWRYFGRSPEHLSWGESATLAVLPNAPSLIFPGKNQEILKQKRDRLLCKLLHEGIIDTLTWQLSLKEKLPGKPGNIPRHAPHLLNRFMNTNKGNRVISTINFDFQQSVNSIAARHQRRLIFNEIYNAAILIIDVKTGDVLAYVGNTDNIGNSEHANDVDIITAARSSGSILKPLLYAACLNEGELLQNTLIPDIPMFMDGFSPKNYSLTFDGAVPAQQALSRSLNVPAVHLLASYGVDRFYNLLKKLNFSTVVFSPDHYGLSLILGGAEVTLWDLCKAYSGMARILEHTVDDQYRYYASDYFEPLLVLPSEKTRNTENIPGESEYFNVASIWYTFKALLEVNRPANETGWQYFSSARKIAWKTGTSFGFRDAWAVGITPQYVVGVWVGNADGEGRPELIGLTAAAPILFDVFDMLNPQGWFEKPYDELVYAPVCHESGYLASINCNNVDTIEIPFNGIRTIPCPFHQIVHLDKQEKYRVNSSCEPPGNIKHTSWFVLPPVMEYYFRPKHSWYLTLPPYKPGCSDMLQNNIMEFVYPKESTKIYVPLDIYGNRGKTVFEVAHREPETQLFWHIDNIFIGTTKEIHQLGCNPGLGRHILTVIDEKGNTIYRNFEIVNPD
ncbi:MAG: penicillin-binding protein 1C [Bacteroidales bacterium]|nr:penicillin-binding protein 1C [Bacteroidales bacterium]